MNTFIVQGGKPLSGSVRVQGSKNAAFPAIAASILTNETCTFTNVPDISDIRNFIEILRKIGAKVSFKKHTLTVNCKNIRGTTLPEELVVKIRGSILFAGAFLGRFRKIKLAYPGGCQIGARPIDVHLNGFRALGARVNEKNNEFSIHAKKLVGTKIVLAVSSVTGTENLILASVLAEGKTEIRLAAMEPHVQTLCRMLNKMGAKIRGIGTPTLSITGVKKLKGVSQRLNPDEIDVMTFAVAAAATKSEVAIKGVDPKMLDAPLAAFDRMKVRYSIDKNNLIIHSPRSYYTGTRILTGVYPQLLTDMQPLFGVLATQAKGKTSIHDWIYEGRLGYLKTLKKMGARVEYDDAHRARIYGPTKLKGTTIEAPDLRAGAASLIAALIAGGKSVIKNAEIIERGYESIHTRFESLGARIERIREK